MRSLPKVLKDIDIVINHDCLLLADELQDEQREIAAYKKNLQQNTETLWQARVKAHKIIETANERAKRMIQCAIQEARAEYDQVHKDGYEQGHLLGQQEGLAEIKSACSRLEQLMEKIEREEQTILKQYEEGLKDLSLCIAKKIIDTQLEQDDELFLTLYDNALKQHREQKWVKLTVSQFEAEFATAKSDLLLSMIKGAQEIKITVAEDAARGTCIVETPVSITDTSVDTQLSKVAEALDNAELCI